MNYGHHWMSLVRSSGQVTDYEDAAPPVQGHQEKILLSMIRFAFMLFKTFYALLY